MRLAIILFAVMLAHPVGIAAHSEGAVVSAKAMAYGASLTAAASPELTAWAEEYVQEHLVGHSFESSDILEAVDEAFPDRPPQLRNAIVYLVLYLAVEGESRNYDSLANAIQLDDRVIVRLRAEADRLERAGRRPAPPSTSQGHIPGGTNNANPTANYYREKERLEVRAAEVVARRNLLSKQQAVSRYRMDALLKLLNYSFRYVKDVPPAVVSSAKPDPA